MQRSSEDKVSLILDVVSWVGLGFMLVFFWGLKSFSFQWEPGDEAIYLYMSWAALDHGAIPYKDYFFAHPPFQTHLKKPPNSNSRRHVPMQICNTYKEFLWF